MPLSEFPLPAADTTGEDPPDVRVPPPGPMSRSALARLEQVECPAFGSRRASRAEKSGAEMLPIVLASGKGSNLFDVDGNRYVDLCAGFGALLLGHGPAPVLRAVAGQAERLLQALGDVYSADAKIALLERIAALHPGVSPRVLLGQSGSDAVTAALKTARLATGKPGVVAFEGCYHGLGYGPLAACGVRPSYRLPFADQLNPRVAFAPYPRGPADLDRALDAVERSLRAGDVGAVLVEPILGRGGCIVPPPSFLGGVVEAAHRHGALVIADEIWTGMGRTGAMVRSASAGIAADILCFGKGLGGGLPISACVAAEDVMMAWARDVGGDGVVHTSTHAGLPPRLRRGHRHPRRAPLPEAPRARQRGRRARDGGLPCGRRGRARRGRRARRGADDRRRARQRRSGPARRARDAGAGLRRAHRRRALGDADLDAPAEHPRGAPHRRGRRARRGAPGALTPREGPTLFSVAESDALHTRARAFIAASLGGAPPTEPFDGLALDLARFQAANIPAFARLARARGVDLASARDASAIPAVPTDVFRLARLAAHPASLDTALFRTSGTTQGARGEHPLRTTATYELAALGWGERFLWPDGAALAAIVLAPPAPEQPDSSLGFMLDRFTRALAGPIELPRPARRLPAKPRWTSTASRAPPPARAPSAAR